MYNFSVALPAESTALVMEGNALLLLEPTSLTWTMVPPVQMIEEEVSSRMYLFERRLETFHSWPFGSDCGCRAEMMAEAGFYVLNPKREPDLVKCFFCLKELDGWEEGDDPWKEHQSHSRDCSFIKLGKKESEITVGELLELLMDREINVSKKQYEAAREQFSDAYETARETLKKF